MRKIIQIITEAVFDKDDLLHNEVTALRDDGAVWRWEPTPTMPEKQRWERLPDIPQDTDDD